MSVGPIQSTSSSSFNVDSTDPNFGKAVASQLVLSRVSSYATSVTTESAAFNSNKAIAQQNSDLEVWSTMAELDQEIKKNGSSKKAIELANQIINLSSNCDEEGKAAVDTASKYFSFSTDGKVVGVAPFRPWWETMGIEQAFSWLNQVGNKNPALMPSINSNGFAPDAFANLGIIYANALTIPAITKKYNPDTNFWGSSAGTKFSVKDVMVYAIPASIYAEEFISPEGTHNWDVFKEKLSSLFSLLPSPSSCSPPNPINYSRMYAFLEQLVKEGDPSQIFVDVPPQMEPYFSSFPDLSFFYAVPLSDIWSNMVLNNNPTLPHHP